MTIDPSLYLPAVFVFATMLFCRLALRRDPKWSEYMGWRKSWPPRVRTWRDSLIYVKIAVFAPELFRVGPKWLVWVMCLSFWAVIVEFGLIAVWSLISYYFRVAE